MDSIPKVKTEELSEVIDNSMIKMSLVYAEQYQRNPVTFINCFLKYPSIKTACAFIIQSYKHTGVFAECLKCGKDFTGYANKQDIPEKWKRVLAEILIIIYSIINNV